MFKLNAYSTGKLPLPSCLCGNSIRIIADATVRRALRRKHPWLPRGRHSAAPALLAPSSISGQAERWRQKACVILTNMHQCQQSSELWAVSGEQAHTQRGRRSSSLPFWTMNCTETMQPCGALRSVLFQWFLHIWHGMIP